MKKYVGYVLMALGTILVGASAFLGLDELRELGLALLDSGVAQ